MPTGPNAIETHELTKRYGQARGIVSLDLEVPPGEVFGFLGPNGAGKSTAIRTLLDFQRPTSGTAEVLGLDSRRDSVAIHRRVGYLPGDLRLFDTMTGAHHVGWFSRARGGHDEALTATLVERFDIDLERPVNQLSKGNRQKVGLLLAFMHRPELLILDEPTSGLDPLVQAEFELLLRETVDDGRTVLLSSHSLDEVQRVADRVAIIREGELVVTDTVESLRAKAPRVMTLTFPQPVDPGRFRALPEVSHVEARGSSLEVGLARRHRPGAHGRGRTRGDRPLGSPRQPRRAVPLLLPGGRPAVIGEITALDLASRRRSLIAYSAGMAIYVVIIVALYPSFKDQTSLNDFTTNQQGLAALFGISGSLTTPTGWMSANIYANFLPLILLMLTIGYGAWCLAGQEHDGRLELVMSLPFTRTRVVLEKVVTMVILAGVLSIVVFLAALVGRAFELTLDVGHLATASLGVMLLGIDLGLLALAAGGASGNRGFALASASTVAVASFLLSSLAPVIDWLKPLRYLSLFYWAIGNGQLDNGLSIGDAVVLVSVGAVVAIAATRLFGHHDLV